MANTTTPPPPDPFVELSVTTWLGLCDAVRECDWIADGGDPTASWPDRDLANLKQLEYDRATTRVMQRNLAYLAKQLSIVPPSDDDVTAAKKFAAQLAKMRDTNVKVSAIVNATSSLLEIYSKTDSVVTA